MKAKKKATGNPKKRSKVKQALINIYNGQTKIQKKRAAGFDKTAKEVNEAIQEKKDYYEKRKG
jgi:hypothetical protein